MWRVRLVFALYGALIGVASAYLLAIDAHPRDYAFLMLGIKITLMPFAIEYAIGVFRDAAEQCGARVSLLNVRQGIYLPTTVLLIGSVILTASEWGETHHIALTLTSPLMIEIMARLIKRLVIAAAASPTVHEGTAQDH